MISDEEFLLRIHYALDVMLFAGFDVKFGGSPYSRPGHFRKPDEIRRHMSEQYFFTPDNDWSNLTIH